MIIPIFNITDLDTELFPEHMRLIPSYILENELLQRVADYLERDREEISGISIDILLPKNALQKALTAGSDALVGLKVQDEENSYDFLFETEIDLHQVVAVAT